MKLSRRNIRKQGSWVRQGDQRTEHSRRRTARHTLATRVHVLTDDNIVPIIMSYAVTTASTHDSRIDLSKKGIPVYRDKGYFGVKPRGIDATMRKAINNFKLSYRSVMRNRRISRKKSLVEYPFAIIKRVFHFSHTLVTLSRRVRVKFMFSCFAYNLFAVRILENRG
jgi:IS5 family transposase